MHVALLVLRLVVGALFIGHGSQKLFGWFGGHGLAATGDMFRSLSLGPGRASALAAGLAEVTGGALFAIGLLTPMGAALIVATMCVAIASVHWRQGVWVTEGGVEYPLVLVAAAFAVASIGAGRYSLDHVIGIDDASLGWGLAALAAGLLAAVCVVALGRLHAARHAAGTRPAGA
jgi:putative oxidoreductase